MKKLSKSEAGKLGGVISAERMKQRHKENIARYDITPKRCRSCSKKIEYDKRRNNYCTQSCAATYAQRDKPSRPRSRFCKICEAPRPKGAHVYCSLTCNLVDRAAALSDRVNQGLVSDRKTLKKVLANERGWCCEICQIDSWLDQPAPLELDHIDGNAGNNGPSNLRLICPNCHALTPTAKGKNRGKGRKSLGISRN